MKKLLLFLFLAAPLAAAAQNPDIKLTENKTLLSDRITREVYRSSAGKLTFRNINPETDTVEFFICPAKQYALGTDSYPTKFFSRKTFNFEEYERASCGANCFVINPYEWLGRGAVKGLKPSDPPFPSDEEELLYPGEYDLVARIARGGEITQRVPGRYVIKDVSPQTESVSVIEFRNGNNMRIYPEKGEFDNTSASKLYIKLRAGAADAVLYSMPYKADRRSSNIVQIPSGDTRSGWGGITAADLTKGVSTDAPFKMPDDNSYIKGPGFDSYTNFYDGAGYVFNEGRYDLTLMYTVGDNLYYKTLDYYVKYEESSTAGIKNANGKEGFTVVGSGGRIKVILNETAQDAKYNVYNAQGALVCNGGLCGEETEIDVTRASKGVNFIEIRNNLNESIGVKKFFR